MSLDGLRLAAAQHADGTTGDTTGGTLGVNHMLATGDVVTDLAKQQVEAAEKLTDGLTVTGADGKPRKPDGVVETTEAVAKRARDVVLFVSGFTGALENILDMGFGALTAPLAAICPSLPAATTGSLYVGAPHTHTHPPSLIPPAPPIPLPSLGAVLMGNCTGVLLCGIPAARAGDKGIAITCGGITPFFDIKLGSSNVFIGGKRAARLGDMCECCQPSSPLTAGAAALAVLGMTTGTAAQAAADAAALAAIVADPATTPSKGAIVLPTAPLVLIGGFPMCPTLEFAKAVLNKLKALAAKKPDAPEPHPAGPEG